MKIVKFLVIMTASVSVMGLFASNASELKMKEFNSSKGSRSKVKTHSKEHEHSNFVVDEDHARIGFTVKHLIISKVHGSFIRFDTKLHLHGKKLAKVKATIKVASIETGSKTRDDHLQTSDFFDAAKYPEIKFISKSVKKIDGKNIITGDLTIKDTTKEIELEYSLKGPIKDPWGNTKIGMEAKGKIDRMDFGLTWNDKLESGGAILGKEVDLLIDIEAYKK